MTLFVFQVFVYAGGFPAYSYCEYDGGGYYIDRVKKKYIEGWQRWQRRRKLKRERHKQ